MKLETIISTRKSKDKNMFFVSSWKEWHALKICGVSGLLLQTRPGSSLDDLTG